MEIRKIHTGLPGLIVDMLTAVVLADIGEFDVSAGEDKDIWKEISEENRFMKRLEKAVKETRDYIQDLVRVRGQEICPL